MRDDGYEAMAVVSHAALLGTSDNIHPCKDYSELVEGFDLGKLSRAPARFDEAELGALNAKLLHVTDFAQVTDRLPGATEDVWLAVRGNIGKLLDVAQWQAVISGPVQPVSPMRTVNSSRLPRPHYRRRHGTAPHGRRGPKR